MLLRKKGAEPSFSPCAAGPPRSIRPRSRSRLREAASEAVRKMMDRPGIYARVGVRPAEEERPEERQPTERRPSSEFQDGARAPLHAGLHGSKEDDQEVAVLSHGCQHSEHFLLASWRDVGPKAVLSVAERERELHSMRRLLRSSSCS